MKNTLYLFLLFSCSISTIAQIKGIVKDSVSGKPIPYVNIWVENENIGITSEENGEFSINFSEKNKNLIFSALGFEKKIIKVSNTIEVKLKPIVYQLAEILIPEKRKEKKVLEIGDTNTTIYQSFDNGPRIDTKYFPNESRYKKTKFIKSASIETDSRIEYATIKIHLYDVNSGGFPDGELLENDLIITVKKGTRKTTFDLSQYNLIMPKDGLFVGFEKLNIEKNKVEKNIIDSKTNSTKTQIRYYPYVMYNFVERAFLYTFSGGKWNKEIKSNENKTSRSMVYEPAINLILTN